MTATAVTHRLDAQTQTASQVRGSYRFLFGASLLRWALRRPACSRILAKAARIFRGNPRFLGYLRSICRPPPPAEDAGSWHNSRRRDRVVRILKIPGRNPFARTRSAGL